MGRMGMVGMVLLLGLAAEVQAGVFGVSAVVHPPFTTETTLTGHTGYLLYVQTDDGSNISAVDVNISGQLHQRWTFSEEEETFVPTPFSANITSGDSHLTPIAGALVGSNYTENNNVSPSPLADTATRDYGYGSFLRGAWGIPGPSQSSRLNLAYLVLRTAFNPQVVVNAQVATSNGTFEVNSNFFPRVETYQLISTPSPGLGSELDFGVLTPTQDPAPLPVKLSYSGIGPEISITNISLTGPYVSSFSLSGTLPTSVDAGEMPNFGVDFSPTNLIPGIYHAQLVIANTSDSPQLILDIKATVVPESTTLTLLATALLAIGFRARR